MSNIKAALFDLDGVLVDTARFHYLAWKRLADQEGIYFDEVINERLKGVSRMGSLEIILERSQKRYTLNEKEKMCETKNHWYAGMIHGLSPGDILPGVKPFLSSVRDAGISTAVCSASKSAAFIINKLELTDYFDAIVGGNDVTRAKPDPEVFCIACCRLGVKACQCVVVEDASAGIAAARSAGMKTIGIGSPEILKNADVVFKGFEDFSLKDLFKAFGN